MQPFSKSSFFFLITIFILAFFIQIQPHSNTASANEGAELPTGAFQTPKATRTETPGPRVPKAPEGPKSPEAPSGGMRNNGLFGPQGVNTPQGINGPQGPVSR